MKLHFQFSKPLLLVYLLIGLLVYSLVTSSAFAASGTNRTINFQGKVVNKSDGTNITDGTYSFTFKIYDSSSGGNQLWSETQSSVSVTSGIFQVALGSVTPFGNIDFNQDNLWLDITFNGETFGSRVRFTAVPQALNAEKLDGVVATQSASGFSLSGGTSNLKTLTVNNSLAFSGTDGTTLTMPSTDTTLAGLSIAQTFSAAQTVQSNSATSFTVGANGSANPVLQIDSSTGSVVTGLKIVGAVTGGTTALTVIDSGSNASLSVDAKGNGTITLGGTSTGNINIGTSTTTKTIQIGASATAADTIILGNSSDTALKLAKFGTQNGVLYVSATDGSVSETAASTGLQCLITASAGVAPTWGSCSGSTSLQSTYNVGQTIDLSQAGTGLTLGINAGVQNVIISPNAGGQAALIINKQSSTGDIFSASASGSTKFVLSNAGNLGIGSSTPQQALTLGSSGNFATEMAAPSGASASITNTGSNGLPNGSYYYKITASDGSGETVGSTETSLCQSASNTHTCAIKWNVTSGAVSYKIYRTSTSGSYTGTNFLTTVTTNFYNDDGTIASLTTGAPPNATTAYANKLSPSGVSWLIGGKLGVGTASPLARLHVSGGETGGNAAFIVDQIGASTNDILTASASGTTKFVVHNDGSIQVVGNNGTADLTTITGGNSLTILPKANASGAGGALVLKGGTGSGAAGGNVTIDVGTGTSNGSISIGANATGITLGQATTVSTGGLTVTSGNVAITAGALTLGGTTRISNAGVGTFVANTAIGTDTFTANTITDSGGLTLVTGSNGSLTFSPNGSGNTIVSADGDSGLYVGSSSNSPAVLSISGGRGSNASFIVNNNNSGDLIAASSSATTKFIVHNDGSIQVTGNNGTADLTTITGGNGLTILPKTNGSGAGGGLTLKAGSGTGAAGGTLILDAGTGSSNGTISLGTTNASGITLASASITTTAQGNFVIGTGGNTFTFNPASGPLYAGNARPSKQIVLSAEYPGAILTASNSATTNGSITSDASPSALPTNYDWQNYYMWTAGSQEALQDYTVAVRVTLPKDFAAWAAGNCLTIAFNTPFTSSALNSLDVYMYQNGDTTGIPIAFSVGNVSGTSKNWTTVNFTSASFGGTKAWNSAGATAVVYLKMRSANTVNYVQVGDITLNYLAAF